MRPVEVIELFTGISIANGPFDVIPLIESDPPVASSRIKPKTEIDSPGKEGQGRNRAPCARKKLGIKFL